MTDRELAGCALSDVLALLEKVAPKPWEPHPAMEYSICLGGNEFLDFNIHNSPELQDVEVQVAICAAVNFLRQHGPALLAALSTPSSEGDGRDGERWRYVRAHMDCLHLPGLDISGPSEERIDAAIDAAMEKERGT